VLLARGALGNPWLFAQVLGLRAVEPSADEVLDELDWVMDRAGEHFGPERAARYLRKFYPWYVERLGADKALQQRLMTTQTLESARFELHALRLPEAA
jgi:tRNA-dihydrouridine synthase